MIHSEPFPDGQANGCLSSYGVYVAAEAVPQIVNQRAEAWELNRKRLYLMLPLERYGMIDFGDRAEQDRLIDMCYRLEPDLVVVDSLNAISVRR